MREMKIVVTGATSFLGAALVKWLLCQGHFVYAIVRPHSANRGVLPAQSENLEIIPMELGNLDQLPQQIGKECQLFFHFGWDGSGSMNRSKQEIQQKNVTDSLKALEGARNLGCCRFLFSGSQAEYGQCHELMREENECRPDSQYGIAKREFYQKAWEACRKWRQEGRAEMEYIHARIFSVYGPGDHPWSLVNSCLDTFLAEGHMELGACTQLWNFLYLDDLLKGLAALMLYPGKLEEDGIYNLAGGPDQTRPLRQYVEEMYQLCGRRGDFAYGKLPPNAEGPANLIPDITKIQKKTGWKPEISFQQGIYRILESKK